MLRDSMLSSTSSPDEEKQLQDLQRKQHMKIIQNNFTLLIILNIVNYLLFLFSFSFYMWYNLQMELTEEGGNTRNEQKIWLNMLYVFNENGDNGVHYMTFTAYKSSGFYICNNIENKQFCEDKVNQMQIVGYASFASLMIGVFFQGIDLYRLIKIRASEDGNRSGIKAFWLHPIIIFFYTAGFLAYFVVVLINQIAEQEMSFNLGSFGASFWIGIASIPLYIFLMIYYRKTKNKLKSSELVDNLILKIDNFEQSQKEKKKNTNINPVSTKQSMSSSKKPELN